MEYTYLDKITYPSDLKRLPLEALPQVCNEVRDFIIQQLSQNPGHLGSSLGTVELTVALHYVFDAPNDQLVWDVGHQAYAHKILTGRRERFHTNRQYKGIAPFPNPAESEYDAFIAGHASNSISAALGIAIAEGEKKKAEGHSGRVVAIIGDGAMTGGLAFEGLNNSSMLRNNLLIVLNDNNMAIDPIKGGFTQYLLDLTTSKRYNQWRWRLYCLARKWHLITDNNKGRVQRLANNLKAILTKQGNNIFQGLNIRYFGPSDGHDVLELVRIFSEIKDYEGPKVLHIITKKGKGYEPAENDQTTWHAPGEFDVETGERLKAPSNRPALWQEVFGETLLELARANQQIVGVTPAMPSGCSMNIMQAELPDRVFDVGIAEGHAVTFSAGMAKAGLKPYCNIYSSFLQRAYDNIIHDVALPKLPVVLCIDRAGIVGNDGATHHGLFDLAYLRPIPNMLIGAPMVASDLRQMMHMAQGIDSPIAIRYPRGSSIDRDDMPAVELGKAACLQQGSEVAVLSIGAIGNTVTAALAAMRPEERERFAHYDMRWLKPIDREVLDTVSKQYSTIITVEDGVIQGGLGSAVAEYMGENGKRRVIRLGVDDQFVEHGSTKELYQSLKLDKEGICESLLQALEQ
jgi:1-deoxy-D-xylulose-5-phosphate synthase